MDGDLMKIKKIVSSLLAMAMIGTAGISTAMAAETDNTAVTIADMNDDDSVEVFDLIELRKAVIKFTEYNSKS